MITLIYGDDIDKARIKLNEVLEGKTKVTKINFEKATLEEIIQAFESQDLFEQKRTIVLENIKNNSLFDKILDALLSLKKNSFVDIVLWSDEALDTKFVAKLKDIQAYPFLLPKFLFPFLDTLLPSQGKKSVELLAKVREGMADELIFFMIVKRIRTLLLLKAGNSTDFDETSRMQSWQLSKMSGQLNAWDEKKLITFYRKLFDLETGMKTSTLPLPLGQHLDILLLSDLN